MNGAIRHFNNLPNSKNKIRTFSDGEFLICLGLMIGAVCYAQKGVGLWDSGKKLPDWETLEPSAHFEQYIKAYRFKEFRRFLPSIYENPEKKNTDPWWRFCDAVDQFNAIRKDLLRCYNEVCVDETMCAFKPQKTKTGGLPNITYIFTKPEPLGSEFKNGCCARSGVMLFMELQRGRKGMKDADHNRELGATAGCTLRLSK